MKHRILIVTGGLAEKLVRRYASESKVESEMKVLPVSVASFITPKMLLSELKGIDPKRYSMILIPDTPSLTDTSLKEVEDKLKVPVFKGSKYAADIPLILDNLEKLDLSKEKSCYKLLKEHVSASVSEELKMAEGETERKLLKPNNFKLGRGKAAIPVGPDFPPRVIAEICDAPLRSDEEIIEIAQRYVREGAKILDIGMVAGRKMLDQVERLISLLRKNFDVPLSIDTLNELEIEEAINQKIDLIVSIDGSTIEAFPGLEVPAVIVPYKSGARGAEPGYYPRKPTEKIKYLRKLLKRARELGYKRVIADAILEPVNLGFVGSLMAFYELRRLEPEISILMGIGNVVELYDADSVGMTALLLGAASELGANLILTAEASDKTFKNVSETVRAINMSTLAKTKGSVPKDLGLDLLILKDKRRFFDSYDKQVEKKAEVLKAAPKKKFKYDRRGFFKIFVHGFEIVAVLETPKGPKIVIKGENAEEICHEILERGLIREMTHAAYLGRELQKAEIALRTGKGYLQEKELF